MNEGVSVTSWNTFTQKRHSIVVDYFFPVNDKVAFVSNNAIAFLSWFYVHVNWLKAVKLQQLKVQLKTHFYVSKATVMELRFNSALIVILNIAKCGVFLFRGNHII